VQQLPNIIARMAIIENGEEPVDSEDSPHSRRSSPPPDSAPKDPSPSTNELSNGTSDMLAAVITQKLLGNRLFVEHRYEESIQQYVKALSLCPPFDHECAVLYANMSACHAKLGNWQECFDTASKALEIDSIYEKARLRRATAGENLGTLASLETAVDGIPLLVLRMT